MTAINNAATTGNDSIGQESTINTNHPKEVGRLLSIHQERVRRSKDLCESRTKVLDTPDYLLLPQRPNKAPISSTTLVTSLEDSQPEDSLENSKSSVEVTVPQRSNKAPTSSTTLTPSLEDSQPVDSVENPKTSLEATVNDCTKALHATSSLSNFSGLFSGKQWGLNDTSHVFCCTTGGKPFGNIYQCQFYQDEGRNDSASGIPEEIEISRGHSNVSRDNSLSDSLWKKSIVSAPIREKVHCPLLMANDDFEKFHSSDPSATLSIASSDFGPSVSKISLKLLEDHQINAIYDDLESFPSTGPSVNQDMASSHGERVSECNDAQVENLQRNICTASVQDLETSKSYTIEIVYERTKNSRQDEQKPMEKVDNNSEVGLGSPERKAREKAGNIPIGSLDILLDLEKQAVQCLGLSNDGLSDDVVKSPVANDVPLQVLVELDRSGSFVSNLSSNQKSPRSSNEKKNRNVEL